MGGRGADHVLAGGGGRGSAEPGAGRGAAERGRRGGPGDEAPLGIELSGRLSGYFPKVLEFLLTRSGGFPSVVWLGP